MKFVRKLQTKGNYFLYQGAKQIRRKCDIIINHLLILHKESIMLKVVKLYSLPWEPENSHGINWLKFLYKWSSVAFRPISLSNTSSISDWYRQFWKLDAIKWTLYVSHSVTQHFADSVFVGLIRLSEYFIYFVKQH